MLIPTFFTLYSALFQHFLRFTSPYSNIFYGIAARKPTFFTDIPAQKQTVLFKRWFLWCGNFMFVVIKSTFCMTTFSLLPPKEKVNKGIEVKHSNLFTQVRYSFTALELDVIVCLMYHLKLKGWTEQAVQIPLATFQKYREGEVKRWHLFEALSRLGEKQAKIFNKDESFEIIQFISYSSIPKGSGYLYIEVPKVSLKLYEPLQTHFTTYQLEQSLSFQSKFTKRMYHLLSQYKNLGVWRVKIDELKQLLGLVDESGKEKYDYNMFKKRVLEVVYNELVEHQCEIQFTYSETGKERKKITELTFFITFKPATSIKQFRDRPEFATLVNYYKLSDYQATQVLANVSQSDIEQTCNEIREKYRVNEVKNVGAYTAKVFKDKFALQYEVEKKVKQDTVENMGRVSTRPETDVSPDDNPEF